MKKLALGLSAIMAGVYPATSAALGLGEIESSSHINQPLQAHIELLSARPADTQKLQVRLASDDTYTRVGLKKPNYNLRFTPTIQNGRPVILVTTDKPVPDPNLVFLVEVSWPQGQLLKEYTVLLDPPPPVLAQPQPGNNIVRDAASVRPEPKAAEKTQVQAVAPAQAAQNARPSATTSAANAQAAPLKKYKVRKGDTLGKLAARARYKDTSIEQMMIALFRANPKAFHKNNINLLKSGMILRRPAKEDVSSISRASAKQLVRRHHTLWREQRSKLASQTVSQKQAEASAKATATNQTPNAEKSNPQTASAKANSLEILGKKDAAAAEKVNATNQAKLTQLEKDLAQIKEALASQKRANAELESRVQALKSTLDKKDRLIQMQNDKLATLEKNLAGGGGSSDIIRTAPADAAKTAALTAPPTAMTAPNATALAQAETPIPAQAETSTPAEATANTENTAQAETEPATEDKPKSPMQLALEQRAQAEAEAEAAKPETSAPTRISPTEHIATTDATANTATSNQAEEKEASSVLAGLLDSNLLTYLGGGSLLLLLLGWLWQRKRNKMNDKEAEVAAAATKASQSSITDEEIERLTHALNEPEPEPEPKTNANSRDFKVKTDNAFNALKAPEFNPAPKETSSAERYDDNKGLATDEPITDEVLAEADVYIAYGLHQQAEAELKKALKDNPARMDYRAKLLENYFNSNNQKLFDQEAGAYLNTEGEHKQKFWPQITEMGRKLSPDNAMYMSDKVEDSKTAMAGDALSNAATVAAGSAAVAGLGAAAAVAASDAVDSNESATKDSAAADQPANTIDTLDFDDLLPEDNAKTNTPANESQTLDMEDAFIPMAAESFGVDDKQDEDLSDLSLEDQLAAFEKQTYGDSDNAETEISKRAEAEHKPLDDADNILDFNALGADTNDDDLAAMVDDFDVQEAMATSSNNANNVVDFDPAKSNSEPELPNLSVEIDQNNGLQDILPKDTPYTSIEEDGFGDLDSMLDDVGDDFSFLDLPDDDLDLQEAQVSTKLDLARAYIDMGDIEGARSTLEEVMVEGNDDQKREAEELLHQTG